MDEETKQTREGVVLTATDEQNLLNVAPNDFTIDAGDANIAENPENRIVGECLEQEWYSFESLFQYFKDKARFGGCMIEREAKNFKEHQYKKAFGSGCDFKPTPSYGYLYCIINSKLVMRCEVVDDVAIRNRKSDCQWTIRFLFDYERKRYVLVRDKCNFKHSHHLNVDTIRASTRRLVHYERQMDNQEIMTVKQFGAANLGITKTRDMLRLQYPNRDYDGELLNRLLSKGFKECYGDDPDALNKFQNLRNTIRQEGGVFEFLISNDTRISDVFIMKSSMRDYASKYGDFFINDGTHNTDMYGLIAMFNTVVDGLGKSVICSYSQYRSEQSDHIIRALQHFSLGREGVTFMTDDGPAYHLVSDHFKMNHLLCTKHYHNLIFPSRAGLGCLAPDYQKAMFDAFYKTFKSTQDLDEHFRLCFAKFSHAQSAKKFILNLQRDRNLFVRLIHLGISQPAVVQLREQKVLTAGSKAKV